MHGDVKGSLADHIVADGSNPEQTFMTLYVHQE